MKPWRPALLVALCALGPAPASACLASVAGMDSVILSGITDQGDLRAQDGTRLRMAGLWVPPSARDAANAIVAGGTAMSASQPDRWGRLTLAGPLDLATSLLSAGLAVTIAADVEPGCMPVFLALEDAARRAGRGVWSDDGQRPIDARNGEAVQARAGLYALAEGRIAHVGWTRRSAYLNFGRPGIGASAELSNAVWRALERQGWTRETLTGKTVRVRGIVSAGRSGRVLVDNVASIEWLD